MTITAPLLTISVIAPLIIKSNFGFVIWGNQEMKFTQVGVFASAMFLSPFPAFAQRVVAPAPPASGKTLDWLNDRFSSVSKSCLSGMVAVKLKSLPPGATSKELSAVPAKLIEWVNRNNVTEYWKLGATGVTRHFGYVFSATDVTTGAFPGKFERYLFNGYDGQAEDLLLRGEIDENNYHQTCDGIFKMGLDTGVAFSGDTIKAAGKATSAGKLKNRVDVAAGTFISPFVAAYEGPDASTPEKLYTTFLFWDWRSRIGSEEGYLIRQFDGFALSDSQESELKFATEGKASANLGFIPFLSIRTSAEGQYSDKTNYSMKNFEVVTTKPLDKTVASRFAIPSEAKLNATIAAIVPEISYGDTGNVLVAGLPNTAFVDVPSVPEKLCRDAGSYEATGVAAGSIAIPAVKFRKDDGTCRFTTVYTVATTPTTDTVTVPFSIHRKPPTDPAGLTGFSIPVAKLQFTRRDIPKLMPDASTYPLFALTPGAGYETLIWEATGKVTDLGQLSPGPVNLALKLGDDCGLPLPLPKLSGTMTLSNRQTNMLDFTLRITSRYAPSPANDIRDPSKPQRSCRVVGTISYDIGTGPTMKTIYRAITDELYIKLPDPVTVQENNLAAAAAASAQ